MFKTLRFRLTILYEIVLGGLLFLSTLLILWVVNIVWQGYADGILRQTAEMVLNTPNETLFTRQTVKTLPLRPDITVQRIRATGEVVFSWPDAFDEPLYDDSDALAVTRYANVTLPDGLVMRVLSLPVREGSRIVAILQVAMPIDGVLHLRQGLMMAFLAVALFMVLPALWLGVKASRFVLLPLERLAAMTLKIAQADDLSMRIPGGGRHDEISQVIDAFNATLDRLETLFTSQQRFLADVSHELRTPLTVINGNVGLMRRAKAYDPELLDSIESEVDRLTRMVESLLLLAKAEAGKLSLQKMLVELDSLLLDVMGSMQVLAADKVTLVLEAIDQVQIVGDPDRLKQVLVNLISNAIKYTPSGGQVFVGLARDEQRVRCWVRDTGPGIPPEDLPHIFERFYRAEKSRTRREKHSGFGLGLSIAYWIVKNHGGDIQVTSTPGEGTTFTVWLPFSGEMNAAGGAA